MSRTWNNPEDGQPATSRLHRGWSADHETLAWELEVRELMPVGSWRLGEMTLRGTFAGELLMAISLTEFFNAS